MKALQNMNGHLIPEHFLHRCDARFFAQIAVAAAQDLSKIIVVPSLVDKKGNLRSIPKLIFTAERGLSTRKIVKIAKIKARQMGIIKNENFCDSAAHIETVRLSSIITGRLTVKKRYRGVIKTLLAPSLDKIQYERLKGTFRYTLENLKQARNVTITILRMIVNQD